MYVRLDDPRRLYHGGCSHPELDASAERVLCWSAGGCDGWVLFNNDADGCAPYDAVSRADRVAESAS